MHPYLHAGILAGLAAVYAPAGEAAGLKASAAPDFGYVYTTQIEETGETELTIWASDRSGKREGHYDAQDYRVELERGITSRFQMSLYTNFASHHVRGLGGEFERVHRDFGFQGVEAEFKYQLLNPGRGGLGLAVSAEPGWSKIQKVTGENGRELEVELKAILQKAFFDDNLVWAANVTLEPEWEREHQEILPGVVRHRFEKELGLELSTGVAYRFAPRWWLGLESRYHSVYPDWMHRLHRENYAVYAGPTIHYSDGGWSVTATWLRQLSGGPSKGGSSLELNDHEKRELRLKISREF